MSIWLQFIGACAIVIIAGRKLVYHAEKLAEQRGWGGVWIGFILLALATTLPELFTSVGAVAFAKAPDLALGNVLGSIAFNLFIIAILDMVHGSGPILRKADAGLVLCGGISIILSTLIAVGISTSFSFTIAGIGPFSIIIVLAYLMGTRFVFSFQKKHAFDDLQIRKVNSGEKSFLKYLICAGFIFVASIWLVHIGEEIVRETGWGETFVGALLLGIATSLPEATTTIYAVRRGAFDMAIGNILGANMLNTVIVFVCDVFLPRVSILSVVSVNNVLTALLGILMTAIVMVGIIYGSKKSFLRLGWDAIGIVLVYMAGSYMLFHLR